MINLKEGNFNLPKYNISVSQSSIRTSWKFELTGKITLAMRYLSGLVLTLRNYYKIVLLCSIGQYTVNKQYFRISYAMTKTTECIYDVTGACFVYMVNERWTWSIAHVLLDILSYL